MRAVMFNKAAQRSFEERLAKTGIDTGELKVQTWHAMGFAIMRHLESVGAAPRMPLLADGGEILRIVGDCIREEFAEHCLRLPMTGPVRSLNLSVSAGIGLFEAYRQCTAE